MPIQLSPSLAAAQNRVAVWTYLLLSISFIPTLFGVAIGPVKGSIVMTLVLFALAIGLMLGAMAVSVKRPILGCLLFFAFAFVEGASIAPLISQYLAKSGGAAIVLKALISTAVIFLSLTVWTWATKYDAKEWGTYLFVALISLLVVSVLSVFFPTSFGQTIISLVGCVLFSLFIVYDTSEVIHGRELNPVAAAIQLYLDVLNLFLHLLRLFGSSDDD